MRWVKEEIKKKTLIERLQVLIEGCDAAIALPGGPGTLHRNFADVELDDRGVPATEASDTGRERLAVRLRSVVQGV